MLPNALRRRGDPLATVYAVLCGAAAREQWIAGSTARPAGQVGYARAPYWGARRLRCVCRSLPCPKGFSYGKGGARCGCRSNFFAEARSLLVDIKRNRLRSPNSCTRGRRLRGNSPGVRTPMLPSSALRSARKAPERWNRLPMLVQR
jgi:hypothetical protein